MTESEKSRVLDALRQIEQKEHEMKTKKTNSEFDAIHYKRWIGSDLIDDGCLHPDVCDNGDVWLGRMVRIMKLFTRQSMLEHQKKRLEMIKRDSGKGDDNITTLSSELSVHRPLEKSLKDRREK